MELIDVEASPPDACDVSANNAVKRNHTNLYYGFDVYVKSIFAWRIWFYMATTDIRRRYRRTLIGPFWVTLSIALFIGSIGVIFSMLWHTNIHTYLPFFSSSYIIWVFVSSLITEACGTYTDSVSLLKQTSLPYCIYANNVVMRNVIVLAHHLTVYLIVMVVFHIPINLNTLFFLPGLAVLCLTASWLCFLLGLIATRYRDIKQLVASFLQISMFITPIFWSPDQLGVGKKAQLLVLFNPLYHFIQIVRAPLLGEKPLLMDWVVTLGICVFGGIVSMVLLGKYRKHLVFWL